MLLTLQKTELETAGRGFDTKNRIPSEYRAIIIGQHAIFEQSLNIEECDYLLEHFVGGEYVVLHMKPDVVGKRRRRADRWRRHWTELTREGRREFTRYLKNKTYQL